MTIAAGGAERDNRANRFMKDETSVEGKCLRSDASG